MEIKRKAEERMRKQKQQCDNEYKKYNEQFLNSVNNYQHYIREKR